MLVDGWVLMLFCMHQLPSILYCLEQRFVAPGTAVGKKMNGDKICQPESIGAILVCTVAEQQVLGRD